MALLAKVALLLLVIHNIATGSIHSFLEDAGARRIAGYVKYFDCQNEILILFTMWGLHQIIYGCIQGYVLFKLPKYINHLFVLEAFHMVLLEAVVKPLRNLPALMEAAAPNAPGRNTSYVKMALITLGFISYFFSKEKAKKS